MRSTDLMVSIHEAGVSANIECSSNRHILNPQFETFVPPQEASKLNQQKHQQQLQVTEVCQNNVEHTTYTYTETL